METVSVLKRALRTGFTSLKYMLFIRQLYLSYLNKIYGSVYGVFCC